MRADGFTAREVQIFLLLHEGLNQTEAAAWLGVRPATVHRMTARCRQRYLGP